MAEKLLHEVSGEGTVSGVGIATLAAAQHLGYMAPPIESYASAIA